MKFGLPVALLLSVTAFAAEPIPEVVSLPPRPVRSANFALAVTAASLISVATSVLGGVIATSLPTFCTEKLGAPSPMCGVGGVALAGAGQLLLSLLIIPELFRISGDDPGAARAGWWQWARWPAAALAVSALVLLAGATSEGSRYGSGQGTMLGALGGAALSGVSVDVMGLIGAVRAAKAKR